MAPSRSQGDAMCGCERPVVVPRRRGSAMIVVVGLLGILSFLGFLAYTVASQEYANAQYFAASAKEKGAEIAGGGEQPVERKTAVRASAAK